MDLKGVPLASDDGTKRRLAPRPHWITSMPCVSLERKIASPGVASRWMDQGVILQLITCRYRFQNDG